MKKLLALALALCVGSGVAWAAEDGKLRIVATIFPEYDWVRAILGDVEADVTLLLDSGVDLHSYQPTVDDMVKIAECDLFIYVGGESDKWAKNALKNTVNKGQIAINLLDALEDAVKPEEIVEGMEHEHHHEEEPEADEHVWLSLRNAEFLCRKIAKALSTLDPKHERNYANNANRYIQQLTALDRKYQAATDSAARKTLLFGDRFPFRYLADDYGLEYHAAFSGCSAETEASFETVMFLAGKVDELLLPCIMTIDGTQHKIAETIAASTKTKDQRILKLDSMQSTTLKDIGNGATYLSIMEQNLETLKSALN